MAMSNTTTGIHLCYAAIPYADQVLIIVVLLCSITRYCLLDKIQSKRNARLLAQGLVEDRTDFATWTGLLPWLSLQPNTAQQKGYYASSPHILQRLHSYPYMYYSFQMMLLLIQIALPLCDGDDECIYYRDICRLQTTTKKNAVISYSLHHLHLSIVPVILVLPVGPLHHCGQGSSSAADIPGCGPCLRFESWDY